MKVAELVIFSGGQTGVERAAHSAALALGVACAGWCPGGRKAEDGAIPDRYPVQEMPGAGNLQKTLRNVLDSDATLLVANGELADGTRRTLEFCRKYRKPLLILDLAQNPPDEGAAAALDFLRQHGATRVYVTGPKASREPLGYDYAHALIASLIERLGVATSGVMPSV